MGPSRDRADHLRPRKIVGISLRPEVAGEFKAEAAQRNLTVRDLLLECWALYQSQKRPSKGKS